MRYLQFFIFASVITAGTGFAQTNADLFKERYDRNMFRTGYSPWTGPFFYRESGEKYMANPISIRKQFLDILSQSERGRIEVDLYRRQLLLGNLFFWPGIGVAIGGLGVAYAGIFTGNLNAGWIGLGVSLAGIVVEFIGAVILGEANSILFRAVWEYNRQILFSDPKPISSRSEPYWQPLCFNLRF